MFLLAVSLIILLVYYKYIKPYGYWKALNVTSFWPWPILGNVGPSILRLKSYAENIDDIYKKAENKRYVGFYEFFQPTLIVKDVELLKKFLAKDFDSFKNHSQLLNQDTLALRGLFSLKYESGWHETRSALSPAFTGMKMRILFDLMEECACRFVNYLHEQNEELVTIEMTDTVNKITNDVIASTVFGVTCDSLKNPENEFYLKGKQMVTVRGFQSLFVFGSSINPIFHKILKINFFKPNLIMFFSEVLNEAIKYREKTKFYRPDMIHLLMQVKANELTDKEDVKTDENFKESSKPPFSDAKKHIQLTNDDLLAQALTFFFAGFDPIAVGIGFTAYELAMHPDIQTRLRKEIDDVLIRENGKISYDSLMKMKYLDCVISEVLRKRPIVGSTDRISVKPYVIEPELQGEKPVYLPVDSKIWIPIYSIHQDPKNYPNPSKFDPDRFSDENKHNIKPFSYLPFGAGPRNCIASRFALMEIKVLVFKLIQHFEIVTVAKTAKEIKYATASFQMVHDEGLWLGIKKREIC